MIGDVARHHVRAIMMAPRAHWWDTMWEGVGAPPRKKSSRDALVQKVGFGSGGGGGGGGGGGKAHCYPTFIQGLVVGGGPSPQLVVGAYQLQQQHQHRQHPRSRHRSAD